MSGARYQCRACGLLRPAAGDTLPCHRNAGGLHLWQPWQPGGVIMPPEAAGGFAVPVSFGGEWVTMPCDDPWLAERPPRLQPREPPWSTRAEAAARVIVILGSMLAWLALLIGASLQGMG